MRKYKPFGLLELSLAVLLTAASAPSQTVNHTAGAANSDIEAGYFHLSDSITGQAFVYSNELAYLTAKQGLIWGGIGALAGLGTAAIINDEWGMGYLYFPLIGAGVGLVSGSLIAYFTHHDKAGKIIHRRAALEPFLSVGALASLSFALSDNTNVEELSVGLSHRRLGQAFYMPNKLNLLYSQTVGYGWYNYKASVSGITNEFTSKMMREYRIGFQAVHLNHKSVVSLLYGLETGLAYTQVSDLTHNGYESSSGKLHPYLGLIIGINMNLFRWLSLEVVYDLEAYGPYNAHKNPGTELIEPTQRININLYGYFR